jgi:hypothetical protein
MKKFLAIVGGIALIIVLGFACFIGYAAYQGRALDASSKTYVEANVPTILSTWSKAELVNRSSPQLLKIINENAGQIDLLFQKCSRLGAMQSFGDVKGNSRVFYSATGDKTITATYTSKAKFKNGDAVITVNLILISGQWQFLLFNVNSPLLIQ